MLSVRLRLFLSILFAACMVAGAAQAEPARRVLHVSLYPYIPNAAAAALTLKQGFEHDHPDVIVEITFNKNYYSPNAADGGVLYEDADVHEIDVVFLRDFLDRHKLAPLPPDLAASLSDLVPLAREAATADGQLVAAPQWMCTDFLIYAGRAGLGARPTLSEMEAAFGPDHSLLMNMRGEGALGELYLSALVARYGSADTALAHIKPTPDPVIMDRLQRMLALEPPGFGRAVDADRREEFYARQFARHAGSAFFGYSEMTHEVLEETADCRPDEHCVGASDVRVAAFPYQDGLTHPAVWVDMFGIDAKVGGPKLADAADFIRYAVSLPAYRALLVPEAGENPRYLLPATNAAFNDPQILQAAPLYPQFRAIIDTGVVVTAPDLNAKLHDVAARIDADLPQSH